MNGPASRGGPGNLNPQLLQALFLVSTVRQEMQALLPPSGSVTVREEQIRRWESLLESALQSIDSLVVIAIFPPPAFAQLARAAAERIRSALATLQAIPIQTLLIFPPRPGQANISRDVLQMMISELQQAETLLVRSLQSA